MMIRIKIGIILVLICEMEVCAIQLSENDLNLLISYMQQSVIFYRVKLKIATNVKKCLS